MSKSLIYAYLFSVLVLLQGCASALVPARNRLAIAGYSLYLGVWSDPHMYFRRGYAYSDLGGIINRKKAIQDYDRALAMAPQFTSAYQARAISKALLGRYDSAISDLNRCIEINSKEGGCYRNRGWIKSEYLKDYAGGFADSNMAVNLLPSDYVSYANRAEGLYMMGDFARSCSDFRKAFSLASSAKVNWIPNIRSKEIKAYAMSCRNKK